MGKVFVSVFHFGCLQCKRENVDKRLFRAESAQAAALRMHEIVLSCKFCGRVVTAGTKVSCELNEASPEEIAGSVIESDPS